MMRRVAFGDVVVVESERRVWSRRERKRATAAAESAKSNLSRHLRLIPLPPSSPRHRRGSDNFNFFSNFTPTFTTSHHITSRTIHNAHEADDRLQSQTSFNFSDSLSAESAAAAAAEIAQCWTKSIRSFSHSRALVLHGQANVWSILSWYSAIGFMHANVLLLLRSEGLLR